MLYLERLVEGPLQGPRRGLARLTGVEGARGALPA